MRICRRPILKEYVVGAFHSSASTSKDGLHILDSFIAAEAKIAAF